MRDGGAERTRSSAHWVGVDPLPVFRGLGKGVDVVLIDGDPVAVGDHLPLAVKEPRPLDAGIGKKLEDFAGPGGVKGRDGLADRRRLVNQAGHQLALGGEAVDPGLHQAPAQLVQHQGTDNEDSQAQQIEGEDQPAETGRWRPGPPAAAGLRLRGIGSRRHKGFRSRRNRGRPPGTCGASA